jgi:hypothetical protein
MNDPVAVRVRGCECPGTPHPDGDVVYLRPKLSLAGGLAASADISTALGSGTMLAELWLVTFVRHGAFAWNLVDEDGDPVPFNVEVILEDYDLAVPVAEKADELYGDTVARPFLSRLKEISRRGRTPRKAKESSTSPPGTLTPKRRAQSSRATTAGTKRSTG